MFKPQLSSFTGYRDTLQNHRIQDTLYSVLNIGMNSMGISETTKFTKTVKWERRSQYYASENTEIPFGYIHTTGHFFSYGTQIKDTLYLIAFFITNSTMCGLIWLFGFLVKKSLLKC